MTTVLGLLAGLGWGFSDYFGGLLGRRYNSLTMLFCGNAFSTMFMFLLLPIFPSQFSWAAAGWGAFGGICILTAMLFFLESMRVERIGVAVPISGTGTALTSVSYGLIRGEHLSILVLIGIFFALLGVVIVSATSDAKHAPGGTAVGSFRGLMFAVASGPLFAMAFIVLREAPKSSGIWPIIFTRTNIPLIYVLVRARHVSLKVGKKAIVQMGLWSCLAVIAFVSFRYAVRDGHFAVPATLASASPVFTAVLAWTIQKEHVSKVQLSGVVCAAAGIALLSL